MNCVCSLEKVKLCMEEGNALYECDLEGYVLKVVNDGKEKLR